MEIYRERYNVEFYDMLNIFHWKEIENRLLGILPSLNKNGTFLDIGAGTGNLSIFLANRLKRANIIAVEPSMEMRIAFIAKIFNSKIHRERITIFPSEINDYRIEDKIDGCFMIDVIGHLSEEERSRLWYDLSLSLKKDAPLVITNLPKEYNDFQVGLIGRTKLGDNTVKSYITDKKIAQDNLMTVNFKIDVADKNDTVIYSENYKTKWRMIDNQLLIDELCRFGFIVKKNIENRIVFMEKKA